MATEIQLNQESKQQPEMDLANARSFIEKQFPVAKLSAESFSERKSHASQTITSLGKWWGRKPLVLVRSTILGLLLPATADPKRDQEIFLKLMTMDAAGLRRRRKHRISQDILYQYSSSSEREKFFVEGEPIWRTDAEIAWES